MNNTVKVFTYGTIKDQGVMQKIAGRDVIGRPATLEGYGLFAQRFDQIPDTVSSSAPVPLSPRQLLSDSWPENFESYGLKQKPGGKVEGMVYELKPDEVEFLEDWELVPFGWYKTAEAEITTSNGQKEQISTLIFGEDQPVDREIMGEYPTFPPTVDSETYFSVMEKARREFLERKSQSPEGALVGQGVEGK